MIFHNEKHLAGEASGSSISNGCQAKTERRRQLAEVGTWRGGTKLHASVAGSRITAFLATAAPWEPYFTDNPRIYRVWQANFLFLSDRSVQKKKLTCRTLYLYIYVCHWYIIL
jgi:hypothetical protein